MVSKHIYNANYVSGATYFGETSLVRSISDPTQTGECYTELQIGNTQVTASASGSNTTITARTSSLSFGQRLRFKGIITINGAQENWTINFRIYKNGLVMESKQIFPVSGSNTYSYEWHLLGGFQEEPTPSYLETLDKLDQWSSAQYIPKSREELNL